jgi:exonuclease VII small subunit
MAEIDLTQLQGWLEKQFKELEESVWRVETVCERLEDRMTILEHAFVGLAAQIDIRLREKGATP